MLQSFPCPRCNRRLQINGELTIDGSPEPLPVFQCDECITPWTVDGETFDTAFTFVVDAQGRALHHETFEPLEL
jgi:hypothetical protein